MKSGMNCQYTGDKATGTLNRCWYSTAPPSRDGRKALESTIPQARRANTQVGANLSAEEREQLGHLLSRLAGVREIDA